MRGNAMRSHLYKLILATTLSMLAGLAFARATSDHARIAGIVVAANTVDIDAGKLAQ